MKRLLLFAKRPRAGHVKTRLVPPLRPEQAVELHRAFVSDQIRFLHSFRDRAEVELWVDGEESDADPGFPDPGGIRVRLQGAGDLGQRLQRAFRRCADEGATATVVIGADSPTLPEDHVRDAFAQLERGADAVVCPADDGGYVLIGLLRPVPELFHEIPWGRSNVLRATLARAREQRLALRVLAGWFDIDDAAALHRLAAELDRSGPERAPATAHRVAALLAS